jgi:TPR repeat protein
MVKIFIIMGVLSLSLFANDYEKAMELYNKGAYPKALKILKKLSDTGDAKAQNDVGVMIEMGQGTRANFRIAAKYYEKSAAQGFAEGQCNYGQIKKAQKKYGAAIKLFKKSAKQGNACGQHFLAVMYQHGKGIKRSYKKAIELYRKSADQGFYLAQSNLAVMYEKGKGVRRDYVEALELYTKSAEQGYFVAQYALGMIYYSGKAGKKDIKKAKELFKKSCDNGHAKGCANFNALNK